MLAFAFVFRCPTLTLLSNFQLKLQLKIVDGEVRKIYFLLLLLLFLLLLLLCCIHKQKKCVSSSIDKNCFKNLPR